MSMRIRRMGIDAMMGMVVKKWKEKNSA